MAIQRGVAQVRVVNHQVVGRGAEGTIDGKDHPVGNGHNFGAARCGQIEAKVDTAGCAVGGEPLAIRAGRIAIRLPDQPGSQARRFGEGQLEGVLGPIQSVPGSFGLVE